MKNPKKNLPFFTLFIIYFIIKENKRKNGSEMTYKNKDTEAKGKKNRNGTWIGENDEFQKFDKRDKGEVSKIEKR